MQTMSAILVFVIIWWLVFLPVLSLGNQNQIESGDSRMKGTDPGAPSKANFPKKIMITTVIAILGTLFYIWLYNSGLISFRP